MWPFSRWRIARQKAYIRKAFGRFLSSALIEQLASRPGSLPLMSLENRKIIFALVQIRDDDRGDIAGRLRQAVEIAGKGDGMIDFMPPLVLVSYGYPLDGAADDWRHDRGQVLQQLLQNCGSDLRIVFGEADGLVGMLGSDQRFHYAAAIPGFGGAMQKLMTLEFGKAVEVTL